MEEQDSGETCDDKMQGYRREIASNLKKKYANFRVSQLPWAEESDAPSLTDCEFNLRVIRKDYYYDEFENSSNPVDLEDIFAPTESNDLLFNDGPINEEPTRILIEADSGYGKTTLTKKIANSWALGLSNTFSRFDLLFVIPVRNIKGSLVRTSFKQVAPCGLKEDELLKVISLDLKKVLLILDGFDELSKDEEENDVLPLWSGDLFADCKVIMTTVPSKMPPSGVPGWPKRKDIILQGFSQNQQNEFLRTYNRNAAGDSILLPPSQKYSNGEKLSQFYDSPLMLSMAVFLPVKNELPETKTELFQDVWNFVISRAIGSTLDLVDLFGRRGDPHPKEAVNFLNQFGKMALAALMKNCFSFRKDEVPRLSFGDSEDNADIDCVRLGFLFSQNEAVHFGFDDGMLEPIHKSFLDFAASYHLSQFLHCQNHCDNTLERFREEILKLGPEKVFGSELLLFLSGLLGERVHILYEIFAPLNREKFEMFIRKQHFLELFSSYAESRNQQSSMQQLYQFNDASSDNSYIQKLKSPIIVDLEIQCRAVQVNFNLQSDPLWPKSSLEMTTKCTFQLRIYVADMIINAKNFFSFLDLLSYKCDRLHFINRKERDHSDTQGTLPCILTEVKYWYSKHFNPWQNLCFHKCEITDRTLQLIHAIIADSVEMLQFQKPVLVNCPIFTWKDIDMFANHSGLRYVSFESLNMQVEEFKSICQNFLKSNSEIFGVELKPTRQQKTENGNTTDEWDPCSPTVKFHGKVGKAINIFIDNISIRKATEAASVSDVVHSLTSGEMFQMKSLQLKSVETSMEDIKVLCEVATRVSTITHFTVLQPDRRYAVHFTCNDSRKVWDIIIIRDLSLLPHFSFPEDQFSVATLMITGDTVTHDSQSFSILENLLSRSDCLLMSLVLQQISLTEQEMKAICQAVNHTFIRRISINFTDFQYVDLPLLCSVEQKEWEDISLQNVIMTSDDLTAFCTSFSTGCFKIKEINFYDSKLIRNGSHSPRQTLLIDNDPTLSFKIQVPFAMMSVELKNLRVVRCLNAGDYLESPEIFSIFVNPEFKIESFEFDCSHEISPGAVELFNDTMANTSPILKKVSVLSNGAVLLKIPEEIDKPESSFRLPSPNRIVHLTVRQSFNEISTNISEQLFEKFQEFLLDSQCELELLRLNSVDFDQQQVDTLCQFLSKIVNLKSLTFEFKESRQVDLSKLCGNGQKAWSSISLTKAVIKQPINSSDSQLQIDELILNDMCEDCHELKQNLLNSGVKNICLYEKQSIRDPDILVCFE